MLEYQESVMAHDIEPNNTGYFSITLSERVLGILKESKYVLKTGKAFSFCCRPIHSILPLLPFIPSSKSSLNTVLHL